MPGQNGQGTPNGQGSPNGQSRTDGRTGGGFPGWGRTGEGGPMGRGGGMGGLLDGAQVSAEAKKLLLEAKMCVSPGIGFGEYGDDHVRFALIENQDRIRQAVRGIRGMFRADGLVTKA